MSIKLMVRVWEMKMSHTEKLVLLSLADQANDQGNSCWPSITTIARRCSLTEQGVSNQLKKLKAGGLIVVTKRGPLTFRGIFGESSSNLYTLNLPPNAVAPPTPLPPNAVLVSPPTPLGLPPNAVAPNHKEPLREPKNPSAPAEPAEPANPEHCKFVGFYYDAWKERTGLTYAISGMDGKQLKELLKATRATAEQLMAVVREAWTKSGANYWSCETQTGTIAKFCAAYNQIIVELKRKPSPGGRNGTIGSDGGYVSPARRGQTI